MTMAAADPDHAHPGDAVGRIAAGDYLPHAAALRHVFLTGDLSAASPHPFFRDGRVELVYCQYRPGDNGAFHWHRNITEYQIVLTGAFGVREAATGNVTWFRAGDVSTTPPGVCVERLIDEATTTVALKVPSLPGDKIHCAECRRACDFRQAAFEER